MAIQGRSNIWQMQSRGDVAGIIQALEAPNSRIRSRAVMALRTLGAAEAVPHLQAMLDREPLPEIRAMINDTLKLLADYGPRQSEPNAREKRRETLLKELRGPENARMRYAIRELGKLGDRLAVEPLVLIFHSPQYPPDVRLEAAEALLRLESAPASAALLGALRKSDWQVRRNAAAVLGHFRADWAVRPLVELMHQDPHPTVRRTALAALRRIDSPAARVALARIKGTSDLG